MVPSSTANDVESSPAPTFWASANRPALIRLTISQGLYFFCVSIDLTLSSLVGLRLAPSASLATLPLAVLALAGSVTAFGAGVLTDRWGHRRVIMVGSLAGVVAAAVGCVAVVDESFTLLCLSMALMGMYRSVGGFIRYAAAGVVPSSMRSRAVSVVMTAGIVSAVLGPLLADSSVHWFHDLFFGSFLASGVAAGALGLVIPRIRRPVPAAAPVENSTPAVMDAAETVASRGRSQAIAGAFTLSIAQLLMTLMMAASPIAVNMTGHAMTVSAAMIQVHLFGMFAPSLVSGWLTERIGPGRASLVGFASFIAALAINFSSSSAAGFIVGLGLNGLGWNLLYLSGSTYVLRAKSGPGAGKLQGIAEGASTVAGVGASLSAGVFLAMVGWQTMAGLVGLVAGAGVVVFLGLDRGIRRGLR